MGRHKRVAEVLSSMTRVCRTKFERDDLNEAMITCGLQKGQPQEERPPSNCDSDRKIDIVDVEHGPSKRSQTWRAPRIFPFNYTTAPLHAHRNTQRSPIPFENTDICYAPVRTESPQATECPVHAESKNEELSDSSLVSPRPPHPRWDDESDPDHPYDNPHYCKAIGNSLWLPRNPCDVLDLDDTVDLSKALTSSQSSGVLRSYIVGSPSVSFDPQSSSLEHSPLSLPSPSLQTPAPVQRSLSGNEMIVLPPHMASRIHSADVRAVPQPKRRHTSYAWRERNRPPPSRSTTAQTNATTWPPVKPSQSEGHPHFVPSSRSTSLPIVGWRQGPTPLEPEIAEVTGILPDTQTQIRPPALLDQLPSEHSATKSTISLAEAVAKEVRVEEEIAEEEDMKEEVEEVEESTRRRPWWMRLFFSSVAT